MTAATTAQTVPIAGCRLIADIRLLVADLPTHGYRRVQALLCLQAKKTGHAAPNPMRVYRAVNRVAECVTDNGSCYAACDTRAFARDIGLVPRTTPVSSLQSDGMAEAFVRTLERDYVRLNPRPDAQTVVAQLPAWLDHYNEVRPHRALGYRSPRELIAILARPYRLASRSAA